MNLEIFQLILITVITMFAGYTQSVSGFGFGIVSMIFLPNLLLYTEANVLSNILSTLTSLLLIFAFFRHINWKNLICPLLGFFVLNYLSIFFVLSQKNEVLMLLLGIALFGMSIYFFFFSDKIKISPTWYAGLIAGMISGFLGGAFAVSGPPIVVYYMQSEKNTERYMGTLSCYFVISGVISVFTKAIAGFVTSNVLIGMPLGLFGMILGYFLGKATRKYILKPTAIKKTVYSVMAISGLVNIISSIDKLVA